MKAVSKSLVGLGFAVAATFCQGVAAQDKAPSEPAKIMVITREFVKPGKGGAPHDKAESAFVEAMAKAKWPTRYVAAQAMSGKPRVLFFTRYDSYDAWEKDVAATIKNASGSNSAKCTKPPMKRRCRMGTGRCTRLLMGLPTALTSF